MHLFILTIAIMLKTISAINGIATQDIFTKQNGIEIPIKIPIIINQILLLYLLYSLF